MTVEPEEKKSSVKVTVQSAAFLIVVSVIAGVIVSYVDSDSSGETTTAPGTAQESSRYGTPSGIEVSPATCGPFSPDEQVGGTGRSLALLDMTSAGRRIRQPPESFSQPLDFVDTVRIDPFEVVQISVIVQNPGSREIARDVRLRMVAPTRVGRISAISVSVEADNARSGDRYKTADVVSLVSLSGRPFRLTNFRSAAVQRNRRQTTFDWGRFEYFPSCALEAKRSDESFEVAIPAPSLDGHLATGIDDAYKVSLLADVSPPRPPVTGSAG